MRVLPRMMTTALMMMMILALSATPTKAENLYDVVWDGTLTAIWQAGDYQPLYQSRMILVSSTPNPGLGGMAPSPLNLDFSSISFVSRSAPRKVRRSESFPRPCRSAPSSSSKKR
jgi:hypothetical protein